MNINTSFLLIKNKINSTFLLYLAGYLQKMFVYPYCWNRNLKNFPFIILFLTLQVTFKYTVMIIRCRRLQLGELGAIYLLFYQINAMRITRSLQKHYCTKCLECSLKQNIHTVSFLDIYWCLSTAALYGR